MDMLSRLVSEKPVVIFSRSSCPSSYSVKALFEDFGVSPAVYELDEIAGGRDIEQALSREGCSPAVPTVYIGGNLVGGVNDVMTHHLNRSLKPMLKRAGAIWV